MKRTLAFGSLLLASALAFALPSTQDVEQAVKAGNYAQAETMMAEVVEAKPQSARAHYVYAEILAHEGKFSEAAGQANTARNIDPNLSFTDPARFQQFQRELDQQQGRVAPAQGNTYGGAAAPARVHATGGGIPGWAWVLGIAAILFFVFRAVSRRAAVAAPMAGAAGGYGMNNGYGPGYGAGYGPGYGAAPGMGGSALRTGLAAAGGVAAGMMAEKWLEGRHDGGGNVADAGGQDWQAGSADAARELENRPVDFGNGGNDWDAGGGGGGGWDAGGGGSFDSGGGGNSDGGW